MGFQIFGTDHLGVPSTLTGAVVPAPSEQELWEQANDEPLGEHPYEGQCLWCGDSGHGAGNACPHRTVR